MLNLKLIHSRFVALAALLGLASMVLFSFGVCGQEDRELALETENKAAAKTEPMNLIPYRKGEKWGFSDANKNLVIQPKYDDALPFSEGLAQVQLKAKWGFIDKTGKEVIPPKYDSAESFSEGLAAVKLYGGDHTSGYIDQSGKEVIPLKYDVAASFSEGLAMVQLDVNVKQGFIDKSGKEVIPLKYDGAAQFSEGLAVVTIKQQMWFHRQDR